MAAFGGRWRLPALAVVVASLIGGGLRLVDTTSASSAPPRFTTPLLGAATPGEPGNHTALDQFESDAGQGATIASSYAAWTQSNFDATAMSGVLARGTVPMLTWEPWDPTNGTNNQPSYRLGRIIAGDFDAYVSRWAQQIKAWGGPLLLRFGHEMNGSWYPWSEQVNGNAPGEYAKAWRRIRGLFANAGATNAYWVWSPNIVYPGSTPLAGLYPGNDVVDWLAVDGYNFGTAFAGTAWVDFDHIFLPTFAQLRALAAKPILIAETASAEAGGDKAAWIRDLFAGLARNPDVVGFVWFNFNKETDWRIESSSSATRAFATALAAKTTFTPGAGYLLDGYGGLHPMAGSTGTLPPPTTGSPYWSGWNIAEDAALLPDRSGGYVLDGYGGLHPFGVGYNAAPPATRGSPYWSGWSIARGVAVLPSGGGGYVLDGWGGLHPFGIGSASPPPYTSGAPYLSGQDRFTAVALLPNGTGGYVLDARGRLYPFTVGSNSVPPAVSGNTIWGYDIANGVALLPTGTGGYVLDGYGGLHPFAIGANPLPPAISSAATWPGWNIANGLAL